MDRAIATVNKASHNAPAGLSKTDASAFGASDGTITGVSEDMEYKIYSAAEYTKVEGATITGLAAGTYLVRYIETPTHYASPDYTIVIGQPGQSGQPGQTIPPVILPVLSDFGTWTGSGDATVRIDADPAGFIQLMLGGSPVDPDNYTVTSGSTVITLKESFLITFASGTYIFRAEFMGGYADLVLSVSTENTAGTNDQQTATRSPQTGDNRNMTAWWIVLLVSTLGVMFLLAWRKWKQIKGTW